MPQYQAPMHEFQITDKHGMVIGKMMLPDRIVATINEVRPPINVSYSMGRNGLDSFTFVIKPMMPKIDVNGLSTFDISCVNHEEFDWDCHRCLLETVRELVWKLKG